MFSEESRYQLLSTICVNLITICYGVAIAWPSASVLILQSEQSPLKNGPITSEQGSWITSLLAVGGLFGNIIFGWLSGKVGRKVILLGVFVPQLLGWILIYVATGVEYLYAARLAQGFSGGGIYVVMPVYVAEISDTRIRGKLGSFFMLACNFGILLAFILGHLCAYEHVPIFLIGCCMAYLAGISFLPETPQYLLRTGQEEYAEKALHFYRNANRKLARDEQIQLMNHELNTIRAENYPPTNKTNLDCANSSVKLSDFCTSHARKAIFIGVFLLWLKIFAGMYVMVTYAGQIFAYSKTTMSPNAAAIIVGVIQLAGTYFAILLVDRAGRRILMAISTIGTALSLCILATYLLLQHMSIELDGLEFVPILSFSSVLFLGSCGIVPMPFVIMAEVMPQKIRAYGSSLGMITLWIFAFVLMKCYANLVELCGMHGCIYFFAGCSFTGLVFVALVLPETRGKSFQEIQHLMEDR